MASTAIANQRLATTAGGGLPLCLSGILNLTQVQCSSRGHRVNLRRSSKEIENSSATEDYTHSRLCATEGHAANEECSGRHDPLQELPRHAFTSELSLCRMADHERRRKAIRKQRSSREIIRTYIDEQRAFAERNTEMAHNIVQELMQDTSLRDKIATKLRHRTCAKAA